jgi:hypothetical protein
VAPVFAGSNPVGHPIASGVLLSEMPESKGLPSTLLDILQHVKETKDQIVVRDNPLTRTFTFFAVREGTIIREWDVGLKAIREYSPGTVLSLEKQAAYKLLIQTMLTPEGRGALAKDLTRLGRESIENVPEPLSRLSRVLREEV